MTYEDFMKELKIIRRNSVIRAKCLDEYHHPHRDIDGYETEFKELEDLTPNELKQLQDILSKREQERTIIRDTIDKCSDFRYGIFPLELLTNEKTLKKIRCMQYWYSRGWRADEISEVLKRRYPRRYSYSRAQIARLRDQGVNLLYEYYWKDKSPVIHILITKHLKGDLTDGKETNNLNT